MGGVFGIQRSCKGLWGEKGAGPDLMRTKLQHEASAGRAATSNIDTVQKLDGRFCDGIVAKQKESQ